MDVMKTKCVAVVMVVTGEQILMPLVVGVVVVVVMAVTVTMPCGGGSDGGRKDRWWWWWWLIGSGHGNTVMMLQFLWINVIDGYTLCRIMIKKENPYLHLYLTAVTIIHS